MKKIQIHGKDYVMVKDRIIFFNENLPNGSITTELKATENSFIFKAKITPDVENPSRYFTGHAEEVIGSSQINKTSALENCETSAIGRALGCMGIGVEESFASADEVKNAMYKQANPTHHKTDNQIEKFADMLEHPVFTGKKKETKEYWKGADSLTKTELILSQMNQRIEEYNKEQEAA